MEILESDFRVHIKVHEQKVQSLAVELVDRIRLAPRTSTGAEPGV